MQMVRDTLGEEAVIVATRDEQGGKMVRVTAAIDPSDYNDPDFESTAFETHDRDAPASSDSWLQYDDEQDEGAVAEELTDTLLRHGVSEDVMDQILSCATIVGFDEASVALVAAVEHLFNFKPMPEKSAKKALMMVGPPGAGKTLAVAKLATRGVMAGLNIGVISCDTVRAGGIDQLKNFTNLLQIDLQKADSPQALSAQLSRLRACHQIIIDTPGTNPFDSQSVRNLAKLIGAEEIDPYFVMPAGLDPEESGEMARVFATIGAHTILPTRIDVARRLGGLLSAAHHGGMSFSAASNTPKVAEGFYSLNPTSLAKLLMPSAFRRASPSSHEDSRASTTTNARQKTGLYQ